MFIQPGVAPSLAVGATPVTVKERIAILDLLRGFALFGILLINMTFFKAPGGPQGIGIETDRVGWFTTLGLIFLAESKFFTLFSLLFGLGFAIQLMRTEGEPAAFTRRFTRRLVILGMLGVAHILFLWEGDILLLYALVGGLLFAFRQCQEQTLRRWVFWLWLIPTVLFVVGFTSLQIARQLPMTGAQLAEADLAFTQFFVTTRAATVERYQAASYVETIGLRLENYSQTIPVLISRIPTVLAMFLLGLYIGKRGILSNIAENLVLLRSVRRWGLLVGLTGSLVITSAFALLPSISALAVFFFNQTFGPILALGYAATLILLARQPLWHKRLTPLAAAGRMALTNYLLQSVICTLIFNGYGLGLVGQVSAPLGVLLAVVIYMLQILASRWWLQHFQYGPMEWLWRSLTYGKVQPMEMVEQIGRN